MNVRNAAGRLLGIYGATAMLALTVAACGTRNPDINTVQPGYVRKSIFLQKDPNTGLPLEWYYRRTIPKAETTNAFAIEGTGDLWLDRVSFDIQEDHLIAYRPHEAIPGSQSEEYAGKKGFNGAVLAAWPITDHFDIIRDYDPLTGLEANTIGENTLDRPWYKREYMRVDFSHNEIEGSFSAGWGINEFPLNYIATNQRWTNGETDPTDPFISRFADDYMEINTHVMLGMDIYTCAEFAGFSGDAYQNCGFGEATLRSSFSRIQTKSDYIPRDYPDSVVRLGTDGKAITDPETGEVLREPIFDRFGFFRTELPTYDRGYTTTESGRLFRAYTFNLWQRHTDDQGNTLPYAMRTPKPIIYYLNAEWPQRWRQIAAETAQEYDRVFKSMVADLQGKPVTDPSIPEHMYEIRDNDCNANNIRSFVSVNKDLTSAVERAVANVKCPDGTDNCSPIDKVGLGNLESVCTSLEVASRDPKSGTPKFEWQRIGDLRYPMLVWLNNPQQSGWGGYGPMHADYRTGETISASAFIRGSEYEVFASTIVDWIELMNDEKSVEDVIYGQDIRKHITQTLKQAGIFKNSGPGDEFMRKFGDRMAKNGSTKEELLQEIDPNYQMNRMKRIEGTKGESDYLITEWDLAMASNGKWRPGSNAAVTDELRQKASPIGRMTNHDPMSEGRQRTRRALTNAGFCFLDYDVDPTWAGVAVAMKDLNRQQRYDIIAGRTLKHVFLHELGHNVGLSHNFEGTYDALNYGDTFWNNHWATAADQLANHYDENRNTTVMEYLSAKGLFQDHLGKYDEAAIRFGYGNQVAVFNKAQLSGDEATATWKNLTAWRFLNDYTKIPDHLCGGSCASPTDAQSAIQDRKWVNFDPQSPPAGEVPFLFCDNTYDRRTPFCATFDYGSNLREMFAEYYTRWSGYFFFNNFIRDRLVPITWSPDMAFNALGYAMYDVTLINQYLYYLSSLDSNFVTGTDLGKDMAITVAHGLNMAAEVMSTPEPVRMCPWPGTTNPQVFIPWYYQTSCDENVAIDSPYAVQADQIQVPLGAGRPATLGFTEDFVDYDIAFVGSYFDKSDVMWYLGRYRPTFFRFNYDLDRRSYNVSLYRLWEPEIRTFYDKMINLDPYLIEQSVATDLGSYWCRDPQNMSVAHLGHYEARQMVDTNTMNPPAGPSADCMQPGILYPSLLRNMPFDAMFYAYSMFSSPLDSQLDMGKSMKVFVLGSDDEYPSWRNLPASQICSVTDVETGMEYRSVHQPAGIPDIGCRLIDRTKTAQVDYLNDESNDYNKERWRSWFERLEWARDLARIYDR